MSCCGFSGGGIIPATVPQWTAPITINHTQFQTAGLNNNLALGSLPAGGIIHGVKLKHSVIWTGPGMTSYNLSLGFTGLFKGLLINYDVLATPVGPTEFAISATFDSRNHSAPVSVFVGATSAGANLSASVSGIAQFWLLISVVT